MDTARPADLEVPPDRRHRRSPGDGWVDCGCGSQHWGLHGAAGLLVYAGSRQEPSVVLQHRALWSHHGGTWGIPGGALAPGETAAQGAVREAVEEAGVPEDAVRLWSASVLTHPDWSYTTIVAEAVRDVTPRPTDPESLELAWVPLSAVTQRPLLPAFATAWPEHRAVIGRRPLLVVDGANVVGTRPDGWWRDRARAAERLHAAVTHALPTGVPAPLLELPGARWWPDVVLVLEGAARGADVDGTTLPADGNLTLPGPGAAPAVRVVRATASGDDAVVAAAHAASPTYTDVAVVSADRALAARVRGAGARVVPPAGFLDALT